MDSEGRPSKLRKLEHEDTNSCHSGGVENSVTALQAAVDKSISHVGDSITDDSDLKTPDEVLAPSGVETIDRSEEIAESDDKNHEHDAKLPAPEEIAPLAGSETPQPDAPALSKSQQKKLRKKAEWDSKREERKVVRKEKQVAKRERKRALRQQQEPAETKRKPPTPRPVALLPITVVIDCDFDDLMRDYERVSLASQITRCYSDNKNSSFRTHLTICSFGGQLRERFDNVLTHYKAWRGVRALESDFVETAEKAKEWMVGEKGGQLAGVFSKYADLDEAGQNNLKNDGEVVYLSSEADEDLTELKPYSTYIIGGLVDKNREKGICYKRAASRGVKTARLPIGEYMDIQGRKVLATNHVNEIMVKWLECGDWAKAFLQVIPKRKGGQLRTLDDGEHEAEAAMNDKDGNTIADEDNNGVNSDASD